MEPISDEAQERLIWADLQTLKDISREIEQLQLDLLYSLRGKLIPNPDRYVDLDPLLNDLLTDIEFEIDRRDKALGEYHEEKAYT